MPVTPDTPTSPLPTSSEALYGVWRKDPTPDNMNRVVRSLDPTISFKLSSMGVSVNPQMRHQARLYAADAVRKFSPGAGVNLRTWTQNQLQSLQRYRRESQGPVKVPDRAAIDAWTIERSARELQDELGFDPDVKQLADRSGLSVKRIAAVRKITRPVAASAQMYDEGHDMPDFLGEALEYVYDTSDRIDRKIIEHTTGYGGAPLLTKNVIAAQLGISPSQVTRRSDRIGLKMQDMEGQIEGAHA